MLELTYLFSYADMSHKKYMIFNKNKELVHVQKNVSEL